MAKLLRLLVMVVVVAGMAGGIYAWVGSRGGDENGNTLVDAEIGSITEKALAVGQIEPREQFQIKSKISGIVSRMVGVPGSTVWPVSGSLMAKISPSRTSLSTRRWPAQKQPS
mgnify:CR=1 FL=1